MIECELCGEYFHPDEIKNCPNCDLELCEECFDSHVTECLSSDE